MGVQVRNSLSLSEICHAAVQLNRMSVSTSCHVGLIPCGCFRQVMVTTGGTSLRDDIMRMYNTVRRLTRSGVRRSPWGLMRGGLTIFKDGASVHAAPASTRGCRSADECLRLLCKTQVHIVVATPGRVLDLANKGVAKLKECHTFVMDEVTSWSSLSTVLQSRSFLLRASCRVAGVVEWQLGLWTSREGGVLEASAVPACTAA